MRLRMIIAVYAMIALGTVSHATVPTSITVQGKVTDASGIPLAPGSKSFSFRIFDAASIGTQLWPAGGIGEVQNLTPDAAGLWIGLIGAVSPLNEAVFADSVRWLEVTVNGTTLPRFRLVTGPYAYRVATVDGASGGNITSKVSIGPGHTATGNHTFVAGFGNEASGNNSVIAGGSFNHAAGEQSTVGGGFDNAAVAFASTVPGGISCVTDGEYSFAAGYHARTSQAGMFVWSDNSNVNQFPNSSDPSLIPGPNFFVCRTTGGALFCTAVNASGHLTNSVWAPAGQGAWQQYCDKDSKHLHETIDSEDILQKIADMPITEWSYKTQEDSVRHVGPTAQDFYTAFQLGVSEKSISTIDESGVALAAIQALYRRNQELETTVAEMKSRLGRLEGK